MKGNKTKTSTMYFGPDVDAAIVLYNETQNQRLFSTVIYPAFAKLAENVIHNMKWYEYGDESYRNILSDIITFLFTKMKGYSLSKGRGFSYFNRITINWILAHRNSINKNTKIKISELHIDAQRNLPHEQFRESHKDDLRQFMIHWSKWGIDNVEFLFENKRDQRIADAIFNITQHIDQIENFNKKAIYIYIREQVDVKTQHITAVLSKLMNIRKIMYDNYHRVGDTNEWKNLTGESYEPISKTLQA